PMTSDTPRTNTSSWVGFTTEGSSVITGHPAVRAWEPGPRPVNIRPGSRREPGRTLQSRSAGSGATAPRGRDRRDREHDALGAGAGPTAGVARVGAGRGRVGRRRRGR